MLLHTQLYSDFGFSVFLQFFITLIFKMYLEIIDYVIKSIEL